MNGSWEAEGIRLGGDARQRFHDARGYGTPVGDRELLVQPIEAAHLLYRGDLDAVDGRGFAAFLRALEIEEFLTDFVVYKDLRERGYYLRPARGDDPTTFAVFERGSGPVEGDVAYRVRVLDERDRIECEALTPGVLAVVDEEGEVGYVRIAEREPTGEAPQAHGDNLDANLVGNRALVWDPPTELYTAGFFGQPLGGREATEDVLQLSLVEAVYLHEAGVIDLGEDQAAVQQCGRTLEGDRFDRRVATYRALRRAGTVPKTGYKFGADFRVYRSFESLESMGHSDLLVRIVSPERPLTPQGIALDVRLAHGVGKRMVFARGGDTDHRSIDWLSIERLTP